MTEHPDTKRIKKDNARYNRPTNTSKRVLKGQPDREASDGRDIEWQRALKMRLIEEILNTGKQR